MAAVASDDFIVFYQTGEQHVNLQLEHILTWTRNQHLPAAFLLWLAIWVPIDPQMLLDSLDLQPPRALGEEF